jgi:NAD+ kinase
MTMPLDLVLVRHGESEGNVAHALSLKGDDRWYTAEFRARHSSTWRLTDRGIEQARQAGAWMRANVSQHFDRFYTSDYLRARETAAYLELENAGWYTDFYLREREWGDIDSLTHEERLKDYAGTMARKKTDSFYWSPPGGESMAVLCNRLKWTLDTLHRECSDKRVVVVCHGEVMWGFRVLVERMGADKFLELDRSPDPTLRIYNGQVIHYTRRNPDTGQVAPYVGWFRSVCPWQMDRCSTDWQRIERERYTNEELLKTVERVARQVNNS